jgi:thiol-disulfide isomerase/thioredoxin
MRQLRTHLRAFIGTAVVAVVLFAVWLVISRPLAQHDQAPERSLILNRMQETGLIPFTVNDIRGQPLSLESFRGRIVIVNFWASWCEPCVEEFPSLKKLIERYKGEVVLIALSRDHNVDDLMSFVKAFEFERPFIHVAWDKDGELVRKYGVMALPESFIAGKDLKVIRKISGVEDWFSEGAQKFFDELVADRAVE